MFLHKYALLRAFYAEKLKICTSVLWFSQLRKGGKILGKLLPDVNEASLASERGKCGLGAKQACFRNEAGVEPKSLLQFAFSDPLFLYFKCKDFCIWLTYSKIRKIVLKF